MNTTSSTIVGCVGLLILLIGINFLIFWAVMGLWNWIAPLFWASAPILTYWQAAGCVVLLELIAGIFKGSRYTIKD